MLKTFARGLVREVGVNGGPEDVQRPDESRRVVQLRAVYKHGNAALCSDFVGY